MYPFQNLFLRKSIYFISFSIIIITKFLLKIKVDRFSFSFCPMGGGVYFVKNKNARRRIVLVWSILFRNRIEFHRHRQNFDWFLQNLRKTLWFRIVSLEIVLNLAESMRFREILWTLLTCRNIYIYLLGCMKAAEIADFVHLLFYGGIHNAVYYWHQSGKNYRSW